MIILALIGYTTGAVTLITIYLAIELWRKISHGNVRVMWHNTVLEIIFLAIMAITIVAGVFLASFERPDGPSVYPYSD